MLRCYHRAIPGGGGNFFIEYGLAKKRNENFKSTFCNGPGHMCRRRGSLCVCVRVYARLIMLAFVSNEESFSKNIWNSKEYSFDVLLDNK